MRLTQRQLRQIIKSKIMTEAADDNDQIGLVRQSVQNMSQTLNAMNKGLDAHSLPDDVYSAIDEVDSALRRLALLVAKNVGPSNLTGKGANVAGNFTAPKWSPGD